MVEVSMVASRPLLRANEWRAYKGRLVEVTDTDIGSADPSVAITISDRGSTVISVVD